MDLGGLGVLDTAKFARALRLRWPWLEWHDKGKIWVGTGNPCTEEDMDLFYASTSITVGDGKISSFWEAPWLDGKKPRDIAPLSFLVANTKKWCVNKALENNNWIRKIILDMDFSYDHLTQLVDLWIHLQDVALEENVEDKITWNITPNGVYSAASAYKAQFIGAQATNMKRLVWKVWPPP